jgi:hypothetical protein
MKEAAARQWGATHQFKFKLAALRQFKFKREMDTKNPAVETAGVLKV